MVRSLSRSTACRSTASTILRRKIRTGESRLHRGGRGQRLRRASLTLLAGCLALFGSLAIQAAETATVTFSLDFPTSDPPHHFINFHENGHTLHYCSSSL